MLIPQAESPLSQWLEWLEQSSPISAIDLGLERIHAVAENMGLLNPKAPVITVAGTNGKGSVVASLEALGQAHQLSVGSYTSPHLISFNERIKINGCNVSDQQLTQAFHAVATAQQQLEEKQTLESSYLSYFEFTTLVALYIFAQETLDFIALEVGLGGRLDAVNVIDADVSVITSIGLDHVEWLGNDLKGIAMEKAGVMRQGKPAVIANADLLSLLQESINTIQPRAFLEHKDYRIQYHTDHWRYETRPNNGNDSRLKNDAELALTLPYNDLFVPNMAAALSAFCQLFPQHISEQAAYQAFETLELQGRFQTLCTKPKVILDVAHNPDSAELLNKKLQEFRTTHPEVNEVIALCGMLKDKDIATSLSQFEQIDRWITCDLPSDRGAKGSDLCALLQSSGQKAKNIGSLVDAAEEYWHTANDSKVLIVFGSFVTVGLMLKWWNQQGKTLVDSK